MALEGERAVQDQRRALLDFEYRAAEVFDGRSREVFAAVRQRNGFSRRNGHGLFERKASGRGDDIAVLSVVDRRLKRGRIIVRIDLRALDGLHGINHNRFDRCRHAIEGRNGVEFYLLLRYRDLGSGRLDDKGGDRLVVCKSAGIDREQAARLAVLAADLYAGQFFTVEEGEAADRLHAVRKHSLRDAGRAEGIYADFLNALGQDQFAGQLYCTVKRAGSERLKICKGGFIHFKRNLHTRERRSADHAQIGKLQTLQLRDAGIFSGNICPAVCKCLVTETGDIAEAGHAGQTEAVVEGLLRNFGHIVQTGHAGQVQTVFEGRPAEVRHAVQCELAGERNINVAVFSALIVRAECVAADLCDFFRAGNVRQCGAVLKCLVADARGYMVEVYALERGQTGERTCCDLGQRTRQRDALECGVPKRAAADDLNAAVSIFLRVSGRPTCVSEVQPINRELFRLVIGA